MYFPHTRTSWDKKCSMEYKNSNFKIGVSLFGCAEKYTLQSTHCARENKKYEYAKSYSNHDGIVEILSVEINSENREIMEFGQEF